MVVHPVGNWWKSVKHSVAWRLLGVAKHGNYRERIKAVHQLARIDHLKVEMENMATPSISSNSSDLVKFIRILSLY